MLRTSGCGSRLCLKLAKLTHQKSQPRTLAQNASMPPSEPQEPAVLDCGVNVAGVRSAGVVAGVIAGVMAGGADLVGPT